MDMMPPNEPGNESPGRSALEGLPLRKIAVIAGAVVAIAAIGTWMARRSHSSSAPKTTVAAPAAVAPAGQRPVAIAAAQKPFAQPGQPEQRKSAAEATLARAQSQIDAGKPKAAQKTLAALLRRKKLARVDRAAALRLMGAAEAHRGHKKAAVAWYRKSLKTTDDPSERDRVAQHIRQLGKARKPADIIAAVDTP
jgi:predicted negative regulator of RcsB-dependent stress response